MNGGDKLERLIAIDEAWQCLRTRAKCPSEQDLAAFAYRGLPFGRMWHVYVKCRLCRAEYFALRKDFRTAESLPARIRSKFTLTNPRHLRSATTSQDKEYLPRGTVYELSPTWHKAQIFLAGVLISIAMLAVFFIYRAQDSQTRSVAEQSRREILSQFRIKEPSNGSDVDVRQIVRGTTTFPELRHYIIVTTPQGDNYVSSEATVSGDSWEGIVTLGSAGAGGGEKFRVRVIATKANLSEGPYDKRTDAISSESIVVTRRP